MRAVPKHQPYADPQGQLLDMRSTLQRCGNTQHSDRDEKCIAANPDRQQFSRWA